ncbi:MAG: dihydroorotate dehydrogenase electron transfer subunit [Promethearchaeota archaeon]
MTENTIQTVKIKRIVNECDGIKTFFFDVRNTNLIQNNRFPKPGQFVMIWVPGVDEVPMSLSGYDEDGCWSITVKNVGECTNAIHDLNQGDYIGVRGPLGNGFEFPNESIRNIFLIGGGIGMAPLKWLSFEFHKMNYKFTLIEGAKKYDELVFVEDLHVLEDSNSEILYCTEDGSYGSKEFASEAFEKVLQKYSEADLINSIIFTCGPEKMMYKVFQICEKYNIELQASLERTMRCGCGLCGLCALDPLGLLVCKDGPVFSSKILRKIEDFGKFKRNFTGKKISIVNKGIKN